MFFKYKARGEIEGFRPRRVFARVDSVEPGATADEEPPTVYLDCIDASWLSEEALQQEPLWRTKDTEPDRRISVIEISGEHLDLKSDEGAEGRWWHLELEDSSAGDPILQYFNLFGDPVERVVTGRRTLTPAETDLVDAAVGWSGISASPARDVANVLGRLPSPDGVAIYDVGQGSCSALLSDGFPCLYFDFGGSAIGNWRSFPAHLTNYCFTRRPPIVLSHWDWDHWSSAFRDPSALHATWILPIQSKAGALGAVHSRFLAALVRSSASLLWCDQTTGPLQGPGFEIQLCKGPATSRNESGFALTLGHSPIQALLPADASPGNAVHCKCTVDHLVVPHHGGRTNLTPLPTPTNIKSSHLIYSYGVGNIFLHPLTDMRRKIRKTWKRNLHTALRDHTGFGHVGIDLNGKYKANPGAPCGGSGCQLKISQWV